MFNAEQHLLFFSTGAVDFAAREKCSLSKLRISQAILSALGGMLSANPILQEDFCLLQDGQVAEVVRILFLREIITQGDQGLGRVEEKSQ